MQDKHTLRSMILKSLKHAPDRIALIEGDRQYTFQTLTERTRKIGNSLLALGLKKGDRVAILSQNSMENAESYFSIPNAGLVLVMLNFRLAPPEILEILSDSKPSALIVSDKLMDRVAGLGEKLSFLRHFIKIGNGELPDGWLEYKSLLDNSPSHEPEIDVKEDDLAALMYTSGTTGHPKGCMVTHRNLYNVGVGMSQVMQTTNDDVAIIPTPLFHASGEVILVNGIFDAIPTIIMPRWNIDAFLQLVEQYKVTIGALATPMFQYLTESDQAKNYNLGSLRKFLFAGAPVSNEIFKKGIKRFGNVFMHAFGTTETVGSICVLNTNCVEKALAESRYHILGSCGKAFPGMEVEVVDFYDEKVTPGSTGEVRTRGVGVTKGYWQKNDETLKAFRNNWFHTGDLGKIDDHGFIYIVSRKKDVIITGAENVYPAEVENVLYKHPDVAQAAVIGLEDEKWGEMVTAVIVKKPDCEIRRDSILAICRKEIAGYKIPKKIYFVESLPIGTTGKLQKQKLVEIVKNLPDPNGSDANINSGDTIQEEEKNIVQCG